MFQLSLAARLTRETEVESTTSFLDNFKEDFQKISNGIEKGLKETFTKENSDVCIQNSLILSTFITNIYFYRNYWRVQRTLDPKLQKMQSPLVTSFRNSLLESNSRFLKQPKKKRRIKILHLKQWFSSHFFIINFMNFCIKSKCNFTRGE